MTELRLSIEGAEDDAAELHDLYTAILADDDLRSARKSLVPGQPNSAQMGAEDVIRLVLDNPGFYTMVSTCVAAWLATRKSHLRVVFRGKEISEIEYDGRHPATVAQLTQALTTAGEGT